LKTVIVFQASDDNMHDLWRKIKQIHIDYVGISENDNSCTRGSLTVAYKFPGLQPKFVHKSNFGRDQLSLQKTTNINLIPFHEANNLMLFQMVIQPSDILTMD